MIRLKLTEPNFRCRVIDQHGRTFQWIAHAESKDALEARLLDRGFAAVENIKRFSLERWRKRASAETERVVIWCGENPAKKTGDYVWRDSIWKYLKGYLFSVSNGKCAFCESDVLTAGHGDVEHFRPKARVEGADDHKGYYWLAYRLENYLPACGVCNTGGKANHFPIGGTRASGPDDDLTAEQPLLLNPLDPDDDPSKHLTFVVEIEESAKPLEQELVGLVKALTPRGQSTRDILKLDREPLVGRRAGAIKNFLQKLDQEYLKQLHLESMGMARDCVAAFMREELTPGAEYCGAKRAAAAVWVKRWEQKREAERNDFSGALPDKAFAD